MSATAALVALASAPAQDVVSIQTLDMVDVAAISAVFVLAGAVKGVLGLGLPTVSLGVLTVLYGLPTAMALTIVPSLVTNLVQATVGGGFRPLARRLWPFLLTAGAFVWLGALALTRVDVAWLSALLGALLVAYSALGLTGYRPTISAPSETWAGPLLGATNGVLTGMTGSFLVPGVLYLQAIGLPRDRLIQAMGMLFGVSTIALGAALGGVGALGPGSAAVSTLALAPAGLGLALGAAVRRRLSEPVFRRVFFLGILALGAHVAISAALHATN